MPSLNPAYYHLYPIAKKLKVSQALEWLELTNPTENPSQNLLMVNPIKLCYKQILI